MPNVFTRKCDLRLPTPLGPETKDAHSKRATLSAIPPGGMRAQSRWRRGEKGAFYLDGASEPYNWRRKARWSRWSASTLVWGGSAIGALSQHHLFGCFQDRTVPKLHHEGTPDVRSACIMRGVNTVRHGLKQPSEPWVFEQMDGKLGEHHSGQLFIRC